MNRLRLIDIQASSLPNSIGECVGNLPNLAATVNECQERYLHDPTQPDEGWYGTYGRMAFTVDPDNHSITTPRDVARVTLIDICKKPVIIRNDLYEFMEFGNGLMPSCCSGSPLCDNVGVFGRGLVVTTKDLVPNKNLRIYISDEADIGKRILVQGLDANGVSVYSQDGFVRVNGVYVDLAAPFVDVALESIAIDFSKITGLQKDITNGPVQVFSVDPDTAEEVLLVTLEPSEQVSSYQRYYLNGLPGCCCESPNLQVMAIVKFEYVPAVNPTDYLIIQSRPAIIEGCRSLRYGSMDIPNAKDLAAHHYQKGLAYLAGLADHMQGKERVSIRVPIFGSDRMRPSMI